MARIDEAFANTRQFYQRKYIASGSTTTYQDGMRRNRDFYRSRSDVVRNPIVDGFRAPSPYNVYAQGDPGMTVIGTWRNGSYEYEMDITSRCVRVFDDRALSRELPGSSARAEAEVRALNAVAGRKGKILESLAEARASAMGIARNANSLQNFALAASKRRWADAARSLGFHPRDRRARRARDRTVAAGGGLGNAWLNYSFGIKPIIDDMVFALIILGQDRIIRVKGVGYSSFSPTAESQTYEFGGAYSFPKVRSEYTLRTTKFAKCVLWYQVRASHLARFNELGAYSVPATAWALVPMSFVVDWVLPVQDVLQALTADVGLSFKSGTYTTSVRKEYKGIRGKLQTSFVEVVPPSVIPPRDFSSFLMSRTVYRAAPFPKPLYVKDPLSVFTAVTSLALLATTIKNLMKGL